MRTERYIYQDKSAGDLRELTLPLRGLTTLQVMRIAHNYWSSHPLIVCVCVCVCVCGGGGGGGGGGEGGGGKGRGGGGGGAFPLTP